MDGSSPSRIPDGLSSTSTTTQGLGSVCAVKICGSNCKATSEGDPLRNKGGRISDPVRGNAAREVAEESRGDPAREAAGDGRVLPSGVTNALAVGVIRQ